MVRGISEPERPAAPWRDLIAPSAAEIEALAAEALKTLPDAVLARLGDVPILIEDFATDDVLASLEIEDPFDLLGLYDGEALTERGSASATDLTRIFLYRRPILDEWTNGEDSLGRIVAHVLIHEIGHHLGLSDDDMEVIEAADDT